MCPPLLLSPPASPPPPSPFPLPDGGSQSLALYIDYQVHWHPAQVRVAHVAANLHRRPHTHDHACALSTHTNSRQGPNSHPPKHKHTHTHLPTPKHPPTHPQTRSPDSGNAKSGCSQASLRLSISFGALLVTEFTPLSPFFAEAVRISGWHLFLRRARLSRCHRNGLHPCSLPPAGGLNSVRVAELQCHEIIDVDHVHLPARTINGPLLRIRRRKACIRLHICSMAHNTGVGNGATVHIVIEPENTRGSRSASSAAALAAHPCGVVPLSRAAG